MALDEDTLSEELQNLTPTASENSAAAALATAWTDYFYDAAAAGLVLAAPGTLSAAKAAMQSALSGMSASGASAQKIEDAITAFWAQVSTDSALIWLVPGYTVAPAVPPPALSAISEALLTTFAVNTLGDLSLEDSVDAVATVLHASGGLGGTVLLTPTGPGSPVTVGIL